MKKKKEIIFKVSHYLLVMSLYITQNECGNADTGIKESSFFMKGKIK